MSILDQLKIDGFAVLENKSFQEAEVFILSLGQEILRTDVKIEKNPRAMVVSAEPIEWHQDSPGARWIAWYCVHPGAYDLEPTEILDMNKILHQLTDKQMQELSNLSVIDRASNGDEYFRPLHNGENFYYCPWLLKDLDTQSNDIKEAVMSLKSQINKEVNSVYSHNWRLGQILVIDNHRFLHRRNRLEANSSRHLLRFWIGDTQHE